MAQYNFGIPSFRIHQIRSLLSDTLVASMSLRVLNAQGALHHDWPAQSVNLGDHGSTTTVQTDLLYENVDVPDPTSDFPDGGSIAWSFILANAGKPSAGLLDVLSKATDAFVGALAGKAVEGSTVGGTIADIAIAITLLGLQDLLNMLNADCDGVVGVLGLSLTAAEVAQITADPGLNGVNCPGTNSPDGCGSNSNYTIYYSMANTSTLASSFVTVPNLIGKSPQVAKADARQAGFALTTVSSYTGPPNQIPVVESQIPGPDSRVPGAVTIEAIVIYRAPDGHQAS